ncbi:MAG: QacE [Chlorobium sp.]|nr:MAG: QacE [Chlorobium sp.]
MAEEKSFFNEGGVSVTNARFMAQGQTYAMSGITSVKSFREDPSHKGPIILGIIGVLGTLGAFSSNSVGNGIVMTLLFIGGAVAWWMYQKPAFSVLLNSASGEAKALTSKDGQFISHVVNALNDAIVHRG